MGNCFGFPSNYTDMGSVIKPLYLSKYILILNLVFRQGLIDSAKLLKISNIMPVCSKSTALQRSVVD